MSKKRYSLGRGQAQFSSKKELKKRAKDVLAYNEDELWNIINEPTVFYDVPDAELLAAINEFLDTNVYIIKTRHRSEFISDKKLIKYVRKLLFGNKQQ